MNAGSSRMFLLLCGLLYLGFGLWVLLTPAPASVFASLHDSPGAIEDLAGSHGGMNVALGLFCIFAALSMAWHRPGLYLVGLVNAGYLAGRMVVLALGGAVGGLLFAVMALEAALCVSALTLAGRQRDRAREGGPAPAGHFQPGA
jgi:hypothetical protein